MILSVKPYDYLASFSRACKDTPYDFAQSFDWHFTHGYVFKGPNYLMLASADPNRPDAWLVFWAEVRPAKRTREHIAMLLSHMPHFRPYVGWARYFKGRPHVKYYSTSRLLALTKSPDASPAPTS